MDLKPYDRLVGLRDALKHDGHVQYSEIHMASLQRGYEWEKRQWTELFNDTVREIDRIYPEHTQNKGPFIGVMILTERRQGVDAFGAPQPFHCEIVDGQQRTTTTFILASIVRDHITDVKESLGIIRTGFAPNDPRNAQAVLLDDKLSYLITHVRAFLSNGPVDDSTPRLHSWPFLAELISKTIYTEKSNIKGKGVTSDDRKSGVPTKKFGDAVVGLRKLMSEARKSLRELVSNRQAYEGDGFEWALIQQEKDFLDKFWTTLVDRMYVVKLSTENVKDAGEVFLSLNSKGKPLGTKDIVKATLMNLHASQPGGMQNFAQHWEIMTKQVGNVDQYLRVVWMTSSHLKTQEKNVAVSVAQHLDQNPALNTPKLSDEIFAWAPVYNSILDNSAPQEYRLSDDPFVHTQLDALRATGSSYRFFLLPHTLRVREGRGDVGSSAEVIGLLRTLSFTWRFVFGLPQELEDFYFDRGNDLYSKDEDVVKGVIGVLREKVRESLQKFKAREMNMGTARLLLVAIEEAVRKKTLQLTLGWDSRNHTVEHIAPQTSTSYWVNALNPKADEDFRYADIVSQIGNLTLLPRPQNSGIQQNPWTDVAAPTNPDKSKREAFKHAIMFKTTVELHEVDTWNRRDISARGAWIEAMLTALFDPFTGRPESYIPFSQWTRPVVD